MPQELKGAFRASSHKSHDTYWIPFKIQRTFSYQLGPESAVPRMSGIPQKNQYTDYYARITGWDFPTAADTEWNRGKGRSTSPTNTHVAVRHKAKRGTFKVGTHSKSGFSFNAWCQLNNHTYYQLIVLFPTLTTDIICGKWYLSSSSVF